MTQQATVGDKGSRGHSGLSMSNVKYHSQLVAYPYFLVSAILFGLQIVFGAIIASQYLWPTLWMDNFAFNIGRETHLNLLIFWLLLGLMGAAYYLIPEETDSEIFNVHLAHIQLGVMVLAVLGTLSSFWFFQLSQGRPFTESPMPWPLFIALGVILFLVNTGITIFRSRHCTAIAVILFLGMVLLAVFYMINFVSSPNLSIDYYLWWWTIHLWVEGAWELIAAAIMAYLLIKLTGVEPSKMYRWLYVEVALVMFTGIIGIGHHYYWIGTPSFWLLWGAVFSALEPVPIVIMAYDSLMNMRHRQVQPTNRVAWYLLGGSAIGHLVGAGVWGFAQTLPQINRWTHGTQITAAHGHFAFYGAFALLVLAAIYYIMPQIKGMASISETRGIWAFWLMTAGMVGMVASLTFVGVIQVYLYRMLGMDFIVVRDQYMRFWLFGRWGFGFVFAAGLTFYLWDFFKLESTPKPALGSLDTHTEE